MTIEELDRQIETRKEELEDEVKYEAYRYLKGFLKYYKSENLLDFLDMDMAAFIDCSLYLDCKNKDIPKFHEIAEITRDLYEKQNDKLLDKIISTTTFFYNEGKIDELIKYYKTEGFINDIKQLNSMSDNSYAVLSLPSIKKSLDSLDMDIIPLLELIKEEGQPVLDLLNFALVHTEVLRFCSGRVFALYTNVTNPKQLEDKKAAVLARELEDFFDVEDILRRMKTIRDFVDEYERVDRNNQKEINELDDSRNKLERDLDKKQIVRYREITKGIRSAKIKYSFLKYIREHNEEYYDELLSEYNKLKQDSKVSIQALLNDYGIPKNTYDYDSLPNYGRDELESILKVLSGLTISNEEKISILQNTTPEKVSTLKSYLDREIIPVSYVSEHIELFNEDSNELDNLKENIKVLKEHNVQLAVFTNSIDILMGEPESINNNIGILESYNLLNGLNNSEDLSFIQRSGLDEVIDKYLELGFEDYLENDLSLLNKKSLERIELLQVVGIPINSKEELESFLSDDKEFFVPLKEIDNYLPNEVDYVEEPEEQITIDMLDKYKATDRVYDFDGIKISIPKVNRLLDEGNTLYQSIIKNTHLNEEQLTKIAKTVSVKHVKELKIG